MNSQKIHDITIVGAGPVGLFGAFYAGMRNMDILLIDSLAQVGGQLTALYPEKYIYDMPGFPKVMAKKLVEEMWEQAQVGNPTTELNQKIIAIDEVKASGEIAQHFALKTESGKTFYSKTVMLSVGMGAFKPRKLDVAGLAEREDKNVQYVIKPLDYYNDREVLIIGGGDSAADWTLALAAKNESGQVRTKKTTLIHRGANFRAHEASVTQMNESDADIKLHHELESLVDYSENGKNRLKVTIVQNVSKDKTELVVDDIIICTGYVAKMDFVKQAGLEMKGNSIVVDEKMETSKKGIFAVGDACSHSSKLKLIATGVGEATIAANFAKVRIDPSAKAFPGHSTSKMGDK